MILHTIIPVDQVMNNLDQQKQFSQVKIHGIDCEVEFIDETTARLIRVYSTDPSIFMEPQWHPGSLISLSLSLGKKV